MDAVYNLSTPKAGRPGYRSQPGLQETFFQNKTKTTHKKTNQAVVAHSINLSTQKAETSEPLWVQEQSAETGEPLWVQEQSGIENKFQDS